MGTVGQDNPRQFPACFRGAAYVLLGASLFMGLYLRHLNASLWVDEFFTAWVVKPSFADAVKLIFSFQGQGIAYFLSQFLVCHSIGSSEAVLRAFSVLCILAAAYFVYCLAAEVFDRTVALIALLIFVQLDGVIDAGISARPYAFALLITQLSVLYAYRWLQSENGKGLIGFFAASALVPYATVLFSPVLAVPLMIALARRQAWGLWFRLLSLLVLVLLMLVPLFAVIRVLLLRKNIMDIAGMPRVIELILAWLNPIPAMMALLAISLAFVFSPSSFKLSKLRGCILGPTYWWLIAWYLMMPGVMFIASYLLGSSVFVSRYYLPSAIPFAVILALAFSAIENPRTRVLALAAFCLLSICKEFSLQRMNEDWREAIAHLNRGARAEAPILFYSGIVESQDLEWFENPLKRGYLSSALSYYPLAHETILVPFYPFVKPGSSYWQEQIVPKLAGNPQVTLLVFDNLVFNRTGGRMSIRAYLKERLLELGYKLKEERAFKRVWVVQFVLRESGVD